MGCWKRIQYEKKGALIHDNELSPGVNEIKKNSVTSVAKSNFMSGEFLILFRFFGFRGTPLRGAPPGVMGLYYSG